MRFEVQHRIGSDLFQDGEILLVGFQQFTQRAAFDGGVGPDLRPVLAEDDVAVSLQVDRRNPEGQAVHQRLQATVRSFREGGIRFDVDGDPHPAGEPCGQESPRIGGQLHTPVFPFRFQVLKGYGNGIGRQSPVQKQTVRDDFDLGVRGRPGIETPVGEEMFHRCQAEQRVLLVRIYDVGPSGQVHLVQTDGRKLFGCGIGGTAERQDIPVGGRTVVIMGEDAGMVQFHPPDIIAGPLDQVHVVDGSGKPAERGEGILSRRPAGLQQRETAFFHEGGVIAGVPVVGVGEGGIVQGDVQEGKVLDHGRLDLREDEVAVHIFGGNPVHDAGKHLGPQDDLKGDQKEQHQDYEGQQQVPDDTQRFHTDTKIRLIAQKKRA